MNTPTFIDVPIDTAAMAVDHLATEVPYKPEGV